MGEIVDDDCAPSASVRAQIAEACPDDATLLALYREQERRIFHLCLGYLKNPADAEDATQEAFVKAARHLPQLAGDPSAYLTVIARNVCCDELRRRGRAGDGAAEIARGSEPMGEDAEAAAIARTTLRQVMTRLRHHEREHLLYSFAGYSYDEMARRTGLSVPAVASIISRARQRARQATESVASVLGPGLLFQRLLGHLWRRANRLPAESTATGLAGLQQAGLLMATVVTGLVAGGWSVGVTFPAGQPRTTAAISSSTIDGIAPDIVPAESSRSTGRVGSVGGAASALSTGRSGPETTSTPGLVGTLLAPPPAQQQDATFSDLEPSPHYAQDGTVFASGMRVNGCQQASCPVLFRTTDRGRTWSQLPALAFAGGQILLPPSYPTDPAIYAMGTSGLQRSVDGGKTFVAVTPLTGPAAMAPDSVPGAARILIGRQPLVVFQDGAQSTLSSGPLLPPTVSSIDDVAFAGSGSHVVVTGSQPDPSGNGLQDGVVVDCAPGCREIFSTSQDAFFHLAVSPTFAADHTYFAVSPQRLYVSRDGGADMSALPFSTPGTILHLALAPDFKTSGHLGVSAYRLDQSGVAHPVLAVSDDGGRSFSTAAASGLPLTFTLESLVLLPNGSMIAGLAGPTRDLEFGLRCSTDGGTTWQSSC